MSEARGPVMHHREDDGKTLVIEEIRSDGLLHRTELNWPTTADGDANWEHALAQYHQREIGDTLAEEGQGQRTHRLAGRLFLTRMWGPPTWWWPRADLRVNDREWKVMLGWGQRAYSLCLLRGPRGTVDPPS